MVSDYFNFFIKVDVKLEWSFQFKAAINFQH